MIEVLKQALDALEFHSAGDKIDEQIITSLSQAIAELESQEPFEDLATELFVVAQVSPADNGFSETIERIESWLREHFTHPPQRTWVGLTKEDKDLIEDLCEMMIGDAVFSTIDAILKGKNT